MWWRFHRGSLSEPLLYAIFKYDFRTYRYHRYAHVFNIGHILYDARKDVGSLLSSSVLFNNYNLLVESHRHFNVFNIGRTLSGSRWIVVEVPKGSLSEPLLYTICKYDFRTSTADMSMFLMQVLVIFCLVINRMWLGLHRDHFWNHTFLHALQVWFPYQWFGA